MRFLSNTSEAQVQKSKIVTYKSPVFQVTITWIWNVVGVFFVGIIAILILPSGYSLTNDTLKLFPDLMPILIIGEFFTTGFLAILFAFINKDKFSTYGLTKTGLAKSVVISAILAGGFMLIRFLITGSLLDPEINGLNANAFNVFFSILLVLFYGPLEVFFVIFLVEITDRHFQRKGKEQKGLFTKGLIITTLIYGLLHMISQGVYSFAIALCFLVLALVYRFTKNIIGPMIAWTMMNNSIWFFLGIFIF